MRVVEGVLHEAQRRGVPHLVELHDTAIALRTILGDLGDRRQRLVETHPRIAVAGDAMIGAHRDLGDRLIRPELRHLEQHAGAVIGPAVIAADDVALVGPALRELRRAVAAAIHQRRRLALVVEEQNDVLAHELERLGPILERVELLGRVPETTKHLLLRGQHGPIPLAARLDPLLWNCSKVTVPPSRRDGKCQISTRSLQKRHR